jgi:ABC-2 type transport system permease protein
VIGNGLHYVALPCIFAMTSPIADERYRQTLAPIPATPARRLPLFLGRALPVIVNGSLVAAFAFVAGGALLSIDVPGRARAPIALVVALTAFSCTGLGLVNVALALRVRLTDVRGLMDAEALVGGAFLVVGYALVRYMERESRRLATLERP